jgi:translation initiation factor eIF-2B subunit alpha
MAVLKSAVLRKISINVIATESLPANTGAKVKSTCDEIGIPCKLVHDSAIGICINEVDCIFVGADCVLENGGIVNSLGTFTIALCAKTYNKPFYVFCETLKFFKRFPLQQTDIYSFLNDDDQQDIFKSGIDYTPPEYISELFTDMGIFTPPAVSDELIKFF